MSDVEKVNDLVERISAILANNDRGIQGAALATLLAMFIAGHHPKLRKKVLNFHIGAVRDLIPTVERESFPDGLPDDWKD